MAFRDEIDAIDDRIDLKVAPTFVEGTVVSVMPKYVRLRVTGSSRSIKAYYSSAAPPEVNERAMATLSAHQNKYVLVTSYPGQGSAAGTGKRKPEDFALAPPNNLAAVALPGAIVVQWDDPVAQVLAYEVQTNTSGVDAGATTHIVTRGMVAIPTATELYARVRSVTTDFRYSSWSDWVNVTPDPFIDTFAALIDVNVTGVANGEVPVWNSALSLWVPGAAGGSFSGDATDVPFTPTTSGDWSTAPTEVGGALDTLAADIVALGGGGGLSYYCDYLTSAVNLTSSNTYYDVLSRSLGAGTWLISATAISPLASGTEHYYAKLWDGTTVYASCQHSILGGGVGSLFMTGVVVVLASTTTVKLSAASASSSRSIQPTIFANNTGATNKGTVLTCIKIA